MATLEEIAQQQYGSDPMGGVVLLSTPMGINGSTGGGNNTNGNWLTSSLSALGTGIGNLFGLNSNGSSGNTFGSKYLNSDWWFTPQGTGDNAMMPAQWALQGATGLAGLYFNNKANKDRLALGRAELNQQKEFSQAKALMDFQDKIAGYGMNIQALRGWNPDAATERMNWLSNQAPGWDNAFNKIGVANASSLAGLSKLKEA